MRQAQATRWLYRIESSAFWFNKHANEDRSIHFLRRFAERVWKKEAPAGRRLPTLKATDGLRYGGRFTSFCIGFTHIELARHHRNILVLLHELTHALGPCQHGEKFVKVYFPLLQKYAGFHRDFLQGVAAERNITL